MSGERIETAGEYTPTTDEVRESYQMEMSDDGHDFPRREAEFDRWLAQVTAEAEARGAREAEAALTKALGQRDAVAVTAERMTSYARQAEAVLREVAAERDLLAESYPDREHTAVGVIVDRLTAILARAEQGGDRG